MEKQIWERPLQLVPNKIPRYPGGREIDRFRGVKNPKDDGRPEAWVGSTTHAINKDKVGDKNLGLSEVWLPTGHKVLLKDLIEKYPRELLGEKHVNKFGSNTCILVKLLDAKNQLGLQTHPTREYARKYFNSEFGKVESWYIIGLREDQEEQPYVLLGFKEGISRQIFEELYEKQDIRAMEEWCHKIPVSVGDVFFVDAGVPHAVGPGCFLIEVQESSDITVGVTKRNFSSKHEELKYKELLLGCYKYMGTSYDENLKKYKILPRIIKNNKGGTEKLLLGMEQTSYFSILEIEVRDEFILNDTGTFSIAIILEGKGEMIFEGGSLDICKSNEIFLPAGIKNLTCKNKGDIPLRLVQAFPPEVF
jgi:mannose-6-phosphate isomerase